MNRTVRKNSLLFLAGSGLYPLFGSAVARLLPRLHGTCRRRLSAAHQRRMLRKNERRSLPARCAIGSLIITVVEFLFGLLVNRVLHLHVGLLRLPLNIMGQICLPFSAHLVRFNDPRKRLLKLCCRLLPSRKRQNQPRSSQTLDIFFWNTGKMPIFYPVPATASAGTHHDPACCSASIKSGPSFVIATSQPM